MPIATVLPPIATVLEDIQSLVATEAQRLRVHQTTGGAISVDQAKALGVLTSALIQSEKCKRELEAAGLNELTDEQLEAELLSELEKVRARKNA